MDTKTQPSQPPKHKQSSNSIANNSALRKGRLAKLIVLSVIGVGISLATNSKSLAEFIANKSGQDSLEPIELVGSVNKTLEQFSFTSEQGVSYHVNDPNKLLDELAKKRGIHSNLFQMNRVRLQAIVSKAGNYGHMGYYERQITIVSTEPKPVDPHH